MAYLLPTRIVAVVVTAAAVLTAGSTDAMDDTLNAPLADFDTGTPSSSGFVDGGMSVGAGSDNGMDTAGITNGALTALPVINHGAPLDGVNAFRSSHFDSGMRTTHPFPEFSVPGSTHQSTMPATIGSGFDDAGRSFTAPVSVGDPTWRRASTDRDARNTGAFSGAAAATARSTIPTAASLDVYYVRDEDPVVGWSHRAAYVDGYGLVRVSLGGDKATSEFQGSHVPFEVIHAIQSARPVNSTIFEQPPASLAYSPDFYTRNAGRILANGGNYFDEAVQASKPASSANPLHPQGVGLGDLQVIGNYYTQRPDEIQNFAPGSITAYLLGTGLETDMHKLGDSDAAKLGFSYNAGTGWFERPAVVPDLSRLEVYHVHGDPINVLQRDDHRAAYVAGYGLVRVYNYFDNTQSAATAVSEITGTAVPRNIIDAIQAARPVNMTMMDREGDSRQLIPHAGTIMANGGSMTQTVSPDLVRDLRNTEARFGLVSFQSGVGLQDLQVVGEYYTQHPQEIGGFRPGSVTAYLLGTGTETDMSRLSVSDAAKLGFTYNTGTGFFERQR